MNFKSTEIKKSEIIKKPTRRTTSTIDLENFNKINIYADHILSDFRKMSDFSQWVKVTAEVEKIWLQYDLDDNGDLDFDEIKGYL